MKRRAFTAAQLILFLVCHLGLTAHGAIRPLTLTTDIDLNAPRWMFDSQQKVKGKGIIAQLYHIKSLQLKGDGLACTKKIKSSLASSRSLQPWLALARIQCARIHLSKKPAMYGPLSRALDYVEGNYNWLNHGPQMKSLRKEYVEGFLELASAQVKYNRELAWKSLNHIMGLKNWLSKEQMGNLFARAGELAFLQQDLSVAKDFFLRSLDYQDSEVLRDKIQSIRKSLAKRDVIERPVTQESEPNEALIGNPDELKLFQRMNGAIDSGDLVSAVKDGVAIITNYWGGERADKAGDQVLRIFSSLARKQEKKYSILRDKVLSLMLKCDGSRLMDWAIRVYYRGYYLEAAKLAAKARDKLVGHPDSTKATLFMGYAAVSAGDYPMAEEAYRELYTRHGGTDEAKEALFRHGLVQFRQENYSGAIATFERLLAVDDDSDFDLQARYWMWRALQILSSSRALEAASQLIKRYPLTYYGLRAQAETNGGKLDWGNKNQEPVVAELILSHSERLSWERFEVLVQAGWFEEAQEELKYLPEPQTADEFLVHAKLWTLAFGHHQGTQLAHKAWDENKALMTLKSLNLAYPQEFRSEIEKQAKANNVSPYLVQSLIKQESAYQPKAVSTSNAHGLMQLIPSTAKEAARRAKVRNVRVPEDLFDPEMNIRLGTSYLRQMIRAFDGHVPLALAAYNAGIGRMRRWLRARPEVSRLEEQRDSKFLNEIWIDELPWSETSFYVKAILRNFLVYQLLNEKKELALSRPIWKQDLVSGG